MLERVRLTALAQGGAGERWLRDLPAVVRSLEEDWGITVGAMLPRATASFVAEAVTTDGAPAILKVAVPDVDGQASTAHEIRLLRIVDGRGCARLLAHDEPSRAMLLERLGRPLAQLGLSVHAQVEAICATVQRMWMPAPTDAGLPSGADKARWLSDLIARSWDHLGRPCSAAAHDKALAFAERRRAAFDPSTAVLAHGDAHAWNTVEDRTGPAGAFKLVDPDGLVAEREYDLAISMREFNEELLAGDALRLGQERCRLLSRLTGRDERAIWEWALVERVANGLLLAGQGNERVALESLRVADAWALSD